jgi:hypothetical protein
MFFVACDCGRMANHGHCGASAADILGQDRSANVYWIRRQGLSWQASYPTAIGVVVCHATAVAGVL